MEIIIPHFIYVNLDGHKPRLFKTIHPCGMNQILVVSLMTAIYLPRSLLSKKHLVSKPGKAGRATMVISVLQMKKPRSREIPRPD